MVITFGGVLAGHTVNVNSNGTFSYSLELTTSDQGLVSAQTTDDHGQDSNIEEDLIVFS